MSCFVRYGSAEEEYYDYRTDPYELVNLIDDPSRAARIGTLRGWPGRLAQPLRPVTARRSTCLAGNRSAAARRLRSGPRRRQGQPGLAFLPLVGDPAFLGVPNSRSRVPDGSRVGTSSSTVAALGSRIHDVHGPALHWQARRSEATTRHGIPSPPRAQRLPVMRWCSGCRRLGGCWRALPSAPMRRGQGR